MASPISRQRPEAPCFALLLALFACTIQAADWQPLPPLPEPNGGCVCGHEDGKLIILGGTNWQGGKKNWLTQKHAFDPVKMSWSTDPKLNVKVAYAVPLQSKHGFSFIGGFDGTHALGTPHGVLAAGGDLPGFRIMVGGTNDPANIAGLSRETQLIGKGESRMADYPGKPFAVAASAVVGDELFVFGGMNYNEVTKEPVNSTEAYAFSPAQNVWRKLQPLAVANRGQAAVALDSQHIYLAGGYTEDFTADAMIYDVKSGSYTTTQPLPYAAMVGLVKLDGFVYCLGGEDKKQSRTDKFFRISAAELLK